MRCGWTVRQDATVYSAILVLFQPMSARCISNSGGHGILCNYDCSTSLLQTGVLSSEWMVLLVWWRRGAKHWEWVILNDILEGNGKCSGVPPRSRSKERTPPWASAICADSELTIAKALPLVPLQGKIKRAARAALWIREEHVQSSFWISFCILLRFLH